MLDSGFFISFYGYFVFFTKSILIIQYINDNNNRCYLRIIYCTAKWSFLYEKRRIRWTVEAYQWGIEGHHYPHTDNGPPQGQSGHWRKQNKRRNQNYYLNFLTQNSKLSIWNVWAKMMTITTAMIVPRHTFQKTESYYFVEHTLLWSIYTWFVL